MHWQYSINSLKQELYAHVEKTAQVSNSCDLALISIIQKQKLTVL